MAVTILVAEDEPQIRELVSVFLEELEYKIFRANDGEEALEIFNRQTIDLIVTDMQMPKVTGIELLKTVKMTSPRTPIIIMTGYNPTPSQQMVISLKADAYLIKPFMLAHLKKTITDLLQKSKE